MSRQSETLKNNRFSPKTPMTISSKIARKYKIKTTIFMRKYHCKASIMLDLLFLGNNSKTGDLTVIDVRSIVRDPVCGRLTHFSIL